MAGTDLSVLRMCRHGFTVSIINPFLLTITFVTGMEVRLQPNLPLGHSVLCSSD